MKVKMSWKAILIGGAAFILVSSTAGVGFTLAGIQNKALTLAIAASSFLLGTGLAGAFGGWTDGLALGIIISLMMDALMIATGTAQGAVLLIAFVPMGLTLGLLGAIGGYAGHFLASMKKDAPAP